MQGRSRSEDNHPTSSPLLTHMGSKASPFQLQNQEYKLPGCWAGEDVPCLKAASGLPWGHELFLGTMSKAGSL